MCIFSFEKCVKCKQRCNNGRFCSYYQCICGRKYCSKCRNNTLICKICNKGKEFKINGEDIHFISRSNKRYNYEQTITIPYGKEKLIIESDEDELIKGEDDELKGLPKYILYGKVRIQLSKTIKIIENSYKQYQWNPCGNSPYKKRVDEYEV